VDDGNLSYVTQDFKHELEIANATPRYLEKNCKLPDGQAITINDGKLQCSEVLFQRSVINMEAPESLLVGTR